MHMDPYLTVYMLLDLIPKYTISRNRNPVPTGWLFLHWQLSTDKPWIGNTLVVVDWQPLNWLYTGSCRLTTPELAVSDSSTTMHILVSIQFWKLFHLTFILHSRHSSTTCLKGFEAHIHFTINFYRKNTFFSKMIFVLRNTWTTLALYLNFSWKK